MVVDVCSSSGRVFAFVSCVSVSTPSTRSRSSCHFLALSSFSRLVSTLASFKIHPFTSL